MQNHEPYSLEVDPNDTGFEDWTITKVEPDGNSKGWTITGHTGWSLWLDLNPELESQSEPKVGGTLRVYRTGTQQHGLVLNGQVIWYRNQEQRDAKRRRELEDIKAQQRRRFVLAQSKMDADYKALPEALKERIDRFRGENPKFREESEGYELFCCSQAALLAEHFDTIQSLQEWKDLPWDEQVRQGPEGFSEAHSGNTFDGACALAAALIRGEPV